METHSIVLAWRIPGTGSLVGFHLWGRAESDTTKATLQQQQQHQVSRPTSLAFSSASLTVVIFTDLVLFIHCPNPIFG